SPAPACRRSATGRGTPRTPRSRARRGSRAAARRARRRGFGRRRDTHAASAPIGTGSRGSGRRAPGRSRATIRGDVRIAFVPDARLNRLADLAVSVGANVQPGQIVGVTAQVGEEEAARAVAESAYRRGAKFVDVWFFDPWVKRARMLHAPDDTLDFVPDWYGQRLLALGEGRGARISFSGPVAPGLMDDLDQARVGRDQLPFLKEVGQIVNDRTTNWNGIACPNRAWAKLVFPELDDDAAYERLWQQIEHVLRLDEPDPGAARETRMEALNGSAVRLSERRFDSLHLEGP